MKKLIELEKKLKEAKAALEKIGGGAGMPGSVATTGGASIASQIGFGKKEDDKDEDKKDKKHPDEKEDKKMIAAALDRHNEKKHGEDKDEDSAQKDMGLKKADDKIKPTTDKVQRTAPGARQPASVFHGMLGGQAVNTIKSPHAQEADIKNLKEAKATAAKTKAEAEAAARRMAFRKEGVLKTEVVKFDKNGQWSVDKGDDMSEDC